MHHIFVQSSVERCLGCPYVSGIVDNAAMNIGVHVSLCICVFKFGGLTCIIYVSSPVPSIDWGGAGGSYLLDKWEKEYFT